MPDQGSPDASHQRTRIRLRDGSVATVDLEQIRKEIRQAEPPATSLQEAVRQLAADLLEANKRRGVSWDALADLLSKRGLGSMSGDQLRVYASRAAKGSKPEAGLLPKAPPKAAPGRRAAVDDAAATVRSLAEGSNPPEKGSG